MSRISKILNSRRDAGSAAFVPYITCGLPTMQHTEEIILELDKRGADVIELGVPFSDPCADGPVIQAASVESLARGTTLAGILDMVKRIRDRVSAGLLIFSYYNPVYRYGIGSFVADAVAAGADGVLIPDLPPEAAEDLISVSRAYDFDTVFLVAPTTPPDRLKMIARRTRGFLYAVSLTGTTGTRDTLPPELPEYVKRVKKISKAPVCVGFSISTPEQAADVAEMADGVIVGSAIVKYLLAESPNVVNEVGEFAGTLISAMRKDDVVQ